jgi:GNAT superfamily N-acetyltransferase
MGADICVREAAPGDADGIARVHIASWRVAYAHIFPSDSLQALEAWVDRRAAFWRGTIEASEPRTHTLVAVLGDDVVGFVDVRPSRDDDTDEGRVGELTAIYVAPEAWGGGVGRVLLAEAVQRLRRSGFEEATLWVLEDNPRARRFYEAAGWAVDGSVKDDEFLETTVREIRYRLGLG